MRDFLREVALPCAPLVLGAAAAGGCAASGVGFSPWGLVIGALAFAGYAAAVWLPGRRRS
jgi:hypothetical protein